jgi:hypothetical protein
MEIFKQFPKGSPVIATPLNGDFKHEFRGNVKGYRNGCVLVRDRDDNVFECDVSQLKVPEPKEILHVMPIQADVVNRNGDAFSPEAVAQINKQPVKELKFRSAPTKRFLENALGLFPSSAEVMILEEPGGCPIAVKSVRFEDGKIIIVGDNSEHNLWHLTNQLASGRSVTS